MFLVGTTGSNGKAGAGSRLESRSLRLVASTQEAWKYLADEYGTLLAYPHFHKKVRVYEVFSDRPPRLLKLEEYAPH